MGGPPPEPTKLGRRVGALGKLGPFSPLLVEGGGEGVVELLGDVVKAVELLGEVEKPPEELLGDVGKLLEPEKPLEELKRGLEKPLPRELEYPLEGLLIEFENPLELPMEFEKPEDPRELENPPEFLRELEKRLEELGELEKLPEKLETLLGGWVGAAVAPLWLPKLLWPPLTSR
ncbi:hypothetical protein FJT64_014731 [Amphibalanus amphitrite]|uniref:Uncharacterized protein n=1 Tax=Amphibalanus amphitrite TaxID=1232801 RepID=A0A6A4UZK2_AMPAM|nr:hypothetical protein FJT64_014731 [Amphibalanus amphitrite]